MVASKSEASLLRRFLAEFILIGLLGAVLLEGGKQVTYRYQTGDEYTLYSFSIISFLAVIICGIYNPFSYFTDIKIVFKNRHKLDFVWKASVRNLIRSLLFFFMTIQTFLYTAPELVGLTDQGSASAQALVSNVFAGLYACYAIDKLGALRFNRMTLLDQAVGARHIRA